ncbi:MAG: hypothetical protein WBA10_20525, partial [Elainellaceae cyanobacterium]
MLHGLMWFPLLFAFIGLAWAGWNEYRKVETYRIWAESCDRAKYDVQAILGQRGRQLIWGSPTRQGPVSQQSVSLDDVESIQVLLNGTPVADADGSKKGQAALQLCLNDGATQV